MDRNMIIKIVVIVVVAIVAIFGINYIGKLNSNETTVEIYTGRISKEFDEKFVKDYKEMKKFIKEVSLGSLTKGYQTYNATEVFNEEFFKDKKIAAISIYEDNTAFYEYHVDDVIYSEDRTMVTVKYTNKSSGYDGTLTSSSYKCMIVELEGTVTNVNFIEITE